MGFRAGYVKGGRGGGMAGGLRHARIESLLTAREGRRPLDADGMDERVRVPVDQFPADAPSAVDLGHAE
jgi:hypothetical protein